MVIGKTQESKKINNNKNKSNNKILFFIWKFDNEK